MQRAQAIGKDKIFETNTMENFLDLVMYGLDKSMRKWQASL